MPGPAMPPKMQRLKTNSSWFTIATPLIGSVPICPTMRLSSRLTKFVITCWISTGVITANTRR